MNVEQLQAAGINYAEGVRRCAGNEELYHTLLQLICTDESLKHAQTALAEGDYNSFYKHSYELKGASGAVSFTTVYELSAKLIDACNAQEYENVSELFNELTAAYEQALEALKAQRLG